MISTNMRERIVIVFIAISIGLLVTTLLFFLYQQTKAIPGRGESTISGKVLSPSPVGSVYLTIDSPKDEEILDRRLLQIKGKTNPENLVIVSTNQEDIVATPTSDGKFSISITIAASANKIITRAIAPNGESVQDVRIVTFSTEEF